MRTPDGDQLSIVVRDAVEDAVEEDVDREEPLVGRCGLERSDGTDDAGYKLPTGVYFSTLRTGGVTQNKQLVILR